MVYILYFVLFLIGLILGILNKVCLLYIINSGKFSKNKLLISSSIRILLISLILFFVAKINYSFIIPSFIGFFLSKLFIKKY